MGRTFRRRGQAMIETVIVMPLFLFILLGLIQLALLHQARLLTKYAAYKAVRAGALNRADPEVMHNAAIAVMLPLLTQQNPIAAGDGNTQPQYAVYNLDGPEKYRRAFNEVVASRRNRAFGNHPMVEVTVCHPLAGDVDPAKDFDDYRTNLNDDKSPDWKKSETTKLSIQVTTYLNLYIPYANAFLWWASYGEIDQPRVDTMKMLRLARDGAVNERRRTFGPQPYTLAELKEEAQRGNYIMPVRASYSMRMQSNFMEQPNLPAHNMCHVPFGRR